MRATFYARLKRRNGLTNIILNERACAERALDNFVLGTKPVETLSTIAKYYYSEGHKKKDISRLLEEFMLKCDPSINIVKWQNTIDKVTRSADKYQLIDIAGVNITQSELDAIKKIDGKMLRRLMFTMLCLAKYGNAVNPNNNNWVNKKDKEIFSLANITINTKRQSLMINDLWRLGYVGYSLVVDNTNLNVKIIDDESPVVLTVTDFRNLGYQYLRYCGEDYFECRCCGILVKREGRTHYYCKTCAVEMNRQKTLENYRKEAARA